MNEEIMFNDLLNLSDEEICKSRIRFITRFSNIDPIEVFKNDPNEINTNWFLARKKKDSGKDPERLHEGESAICLVRLPEDIDLWLFTCIKRIGKPMERPKEEDGNDYYVGYAAEELPQYSKFYGRVILRYHKGKGEQNPVRQTKNVLDKIIVIKILPDIFNDDGFPGYDHISLSYRQLESIWKRDRSDWKNALSHQQGVYVVTDTETGKLYVGSATGKNGIYQRWMDYILDGHGDDTELRDIVKQHGMNYIKDHFRYTLLEHYDSTVPRDVVIARESYWKNALNTRQHGYNGN